MKLKTLKVENFRGIQGGQNILEFDENNIVFIFGKNNIGKSSILHAYKYFSATNQQAAITDFHNHNTKKPICIEAVFTKEDSDANNFNAKGLNKWVSPSGEIRIRKTWLAVGLPANKETFDPLTETFTPNGFGGMEPILTSALPNIIFIEAMPSTKTLIDWLEKEIKTRLLKKLKETHKDEYDAALISIKKLQDRVESDEYLGKIKTGANKYFAKTFPDLELKICSTPNKEADLSKAFEKDFSITIGKKIGNDPILANAIETLEELELIGGENIGNDAPPSHREFELHGHGLIRQAIINILGLCKDAKADQKQIILFEEPELYLHPSNKRRFRDTLYEIAEQDNYQIICVSHDPQLIDLSRPHTSLVRFVRNEDGSTTLHQAGNNIFHKDEETKDRIQMLNRFNPHVCEAFFADEVVLVEGDTEAIVVRELLHKHYKEKEIFVLNTGSKNNIPFFIKALGHFRIKQHIIHDTDERYLYEKGSVKKNADGSNTKNSAWALNESIWDQIIATNVANPIACRYLSIRNFEHSHGYKPDPNLGKPLSAHKFAQTIDITNESIAIVKILKQITGELPVTNIPCQVHIEATVVEPF